MTTSEQVKSYKTKLDDYLQYFQKTPKELKQLQILFAALAKQQKISASLKQSEQTTTNQELDNWLGKITTSINTLLSQKFASQLAAHEGLADKLDGTLTAIS